MRTYTFAPLMAYLLASVACRTEVELPDAYCAHIDMKGSVPADLAPMPAKCAAARGVAGNNLLCVDFSQITDLTNDPTLVGWNFDKFDKSCWSIKNGKLQVSNFLSYMGSCGFLMPALSSSDYQKYNNFTLSVVHTVDINDPKQRTQIFLGLDDLMSRLVLQTTGQMPTQQSIITITKSALPNGGTSLYQPLFKITSGVQVGTANQGWQIESIAINASL